MHEVCKSVYMTACVLKGTSVIFEEAVNFTLNPCLYGTVASKLIYPTFVYRKIQLLVF
jgi:hypothetical protein